MERAFTTGEVSWVDPRVARRIAEQVVAKLAEPVQVGALTLSISGSVGIALGPGTYQTPAEMLRAADGALYTAKQRGKAQVALLEPDGGRASSAVWQRSRAG